MKIKIIFILLLVYACNSKPVEESVLKTPVERGTDSIQQNDSVYRFVEAFKGTLRCEDCPGIKTEITFINDILTYREKTTFMVKDFTNYTTGSYTTDRGYKNDDDATVYVLDDNKPGHERRFLKLNDSTLIKLDANDNISDTSKLAKLYRIK